MDYRKYYDLTTYLFDEVTDRFKEQHFLSAFDFFCIVIWKANRAKSKVAARLLNTSGCDDLETAVYTLTNSISNQHNAKERLRYLMEDWNFRLPMATAILTVLYPDEFTVYDIRVCETLGEFSNLGNAANFEQLWAGYEEFKRKVDVSVSQQLSLRDKDKYLWGKSFYNQLQRDIEQRFNRD